MFHPKTTSLFSQIPFPGRQVLSTALFLELESLQLISHALLNSINKCLWIKHSHHSSAKLKSTSIRKTVPTKSQWPFTQPKITQPKLVKDIQYLSQIQFTLTLPFQKMTPDI